MLQSISPNRFRLVCFDLSIYGHHAHYIRCLSRGWAEQTTKDMLTFVVSPEFMAVHSDVVCECSKLAKSIDFVAISDAEQSALQPRKSGFSRNLRNFQEWRLFARYAEEIKATHGLMLYLDTCLLPLAAGLPFPCPVSGIYFRPTFHYHTFSNHTQTAKDRIQAWRERLILGQALRHPQFTRLLSLDPFAPAHINSPKGVTVEPLADPIDTTWQGHTSNPELREKLGIESDRTVFLLFGALTVRKGIYPLLESLDLLSDEVCQKTALVLLGEASPQTQQRIATSVARLRQQRPLQILERYEFVDEAELHQHIAMADVVLAPYQKHVGMSGIVLQAALHEKPILSSSYGLMGELVKKYELGSIVDSDSPRQIANQITQFTAKNYYKDLNKSGMKAIASQNSIENFSTLLLSS